MKYNPAYLLVAVLVLGCSEEPQQVETAPNPTQSEASTKANKTPPTNQSLLSAISFGEHEKAITLLADGASVNAKDRYGHPVIFLAAKQGHPGLLKAVIKAGGDVNATLSTKYNDDGVGYSGTTDGTPLTYAAREGHIDAAKVLIDAGADINGMGPEGTSALMAAAENGQADMVEWLLGQGAIEGHAAALVIAMRVVNPNDERQRVIELLE